MSKENLTPNEPDFSAGIAEPVPPASDQTPLNKLASDPILAERARRIAWQLQAVTSGHLDGNPYLTDVIRGPEGVPCLKRDPKVLLYIQRLLNHRA